MYVCMYIYAYTCTYNYTRTHTPSIWVWPSSQSSHRQTRTPAMSLPEEKYTRSSLFFIFYLEKYTGSFFSKQHSVLQLY